MSSNLSGLSDRELLSNLGRLVRDERRRLVEILHHVNEVERRGLYLKLGHASLFDYCTEHLKYSRSAAGRRIAVARCMRRVPEIGTLLERGELSLMTASLSARILTPENKVRLLASLRGKSQRQVETILAAHAPQPAVRDRVRPVTVRAPLADLGRKGAAKGPRLSAGSCEAEVASEEDRSGRVSLAEIGSFATPSAGSEPRTAAQGHSDDSVPERGAVPTAAEAMLPRTRLEHRHKFEFAAGDEFMAMFEKMRALLGSHAHGQPSFEDVFLAGMDAWLDKHDPERGHARRVARRQAAGAPKGRRLERGSTGAPPNEREKATNSRSRHIPAALRDAVHAKHHGRCSYVAPSGRRCGATRHLQIDHVTPFARGGRHEEGNLRLLCARHNRIEADRLLGHDVMARHRRE